MITKKASQEVSFWTIAGVIAAFVLVIVIVGLYFFGGNYVKFFSWLGFDGNKTQEIEGIEIFRYNITEAKIQYYDGTLFSDFNEGETLRLNNKRIEADTLLEDFEKWYYYGREEKTIPVQNGKIYSINEFYTLIKDTSGNALPQGDIDYLVSKSINEMWCASILTTSITQTSGISLHGKDFVFSLKNVFNENSNNKNFIYLNDKETNVYIAQKAININDGNGIITIGYLDKKSDVCRYDFNLYEIRKKNGQRLVNSVFGGDEDYFNMLNGALIEEWRIILKNSEAAKLIEEHDAKINREKLDIENVEISKYGFDSKEVKIWLEEKKSGKAIISAGNFILGADNKFYFSYETRTPEKKIEILKADFLNIYNEAKNWRDSIFTKPIPITIFPVSENTKVESPIYICPQFKDNKYIVVDLAKKAKGDLCV